MPRLMLHLPLSQAGESFSFTAAKFHLMLQYGCRCLLNYTCLQVLVNNNLQGKGAVVYIGTRGKVTYGIKTHGSESRGQEEAGHMRRTSELFTHSTAVKFVDTLNKPPLNEV